MTVLLGLASLARPMTVVAVDVGRTHGRAAWFAAPGAPAPTATATVASGATLVDPGGPARVAATVTAALAALGRPDGPATLVVAAAGSLSRPDATAALADRLARELGTPGPTSIGEVVVTSDVVAAHSAAFDGAAGVVLAVGTGAVALAIGPDGRHALVDGGGYLIGDAGSGFAIGRAGLAAAVRQADGRPGGSPALAAAAAARFAPGGTVRDAARALYGAADPARQVASFASDVAAAARAGDRPAAAIWRDAVAQLADTVTAACAVGAGGEVALTGALGEVDDLLVAPLRGLMAQRDPNITIRTGWGDALAGAARLARRPAGRYESLLRSQAVGRHPNGSRELSEVKEG